MSQEMDVMNISGDFPILQKLRIDNSEFIPPSFYKSLEEFCYRNVISVEFYEFRVKKVEKEICVQCLKAFIFDTAITYYHMSIDILILANRLDGDIGHLNYYLDNGNVRSIGQFL